MLSPGVTAFSVILPAVPFLPLICKISPGDFKKATQENLGSSANKMENCTKILQG